MAIHYLPAHLIDKLKAGEIVERPASIVKELLENSLDAGATHLRIRIEEGGMQMIKIQDNGSGIDESDLPLVLARYATSKIRSDEDLEMIATYGFRGEALAAIAEVSGCTVQTRTVHAPAGIGYELHKVAGEPFIKQIPFAEAQGTIITIKELFAHVPVRKKFLKSATTERQHIRQLLFTYLLLHRDKSRQVRHNNKIIWQVQQASSLKERVSVLTNKERQPHLHEFFYTDEYIAVEGILGDASLHFPTTEQLRFFVNARPVEDKIMKKALLEVMRRQLPAGLYPFAYVFLTIDPGRVDVNVHPRKMEVKFLDPSEIFSVVTRAVQQQTSEQKVSYAAFTQPTVQSSGSWKRSKASFPVNEVKKLQTSYHGAADSSLFDQIQGEFGGDLVLGEEAVQVVGQLRNSYILASSATGMYMIDQHALAERITFERMKHALQEHGFVPEVLLHPLIVSLPSNDIAVDQRIDLLGSLGIDMSEFGEQKVIIHTMPTVFTQYTLDLQTVLMLLRGQQKLWLERGKTLVAYDFFGTILEEIISMKACKASITAGQSLSIIEMTQLLRDGQAVIGQMFVCQHGRPSVLKIPRADIESMVGR